MQELLGRISALDPEASLGIRVIACFDELMIGNVNTQALLSAAAALAGCPAGATQDDPARTMRVSPRGEPLSEDAPESPQIHEVTAGTRVWLEREGPPAANDAIILERLGLAVGVRLGHERRVLEPRRDLGVVLDPETDDPARRTALARLGLAPAGRYRVLAAPLFAVWANHPPGRGDVISTEFGPIHTVVVHADVAQPDVRPSGMGVAVAAGDLPRSFRTALVALRLCAAPEQPWVRADEYGGLVELLADAPADRQNRDADLLDEIMAAPWARSTVEAALASTTARQAARHCRVHHSTMQTRLDTLTQKLGFDPIEGFGRTRLGLAYLIWRLRTSRVLDLPTPAGQVPARAQA